MSTNEVITPTANQSVSTPMMEAIQSVTRQGARALRNSNQPQEWKLISLREAAVYAGGPLGDVGHPRLETFNQRLVLQDAVKPHQG